MALDKIEEKNPIPPPELHIRLFSRLKCGGIRDRWRKVKILTQDEASNIIDLADKNEYTRRAKQRADAMLEARKK